MPVPTRLPAGARRADGTLADVAYGVGNRCERAGDLERAARWFRRAAEAERPEAALRLGAVLGRLADARDPVGSSEVLLAEATRWLSEASDTTTPDAIEVITAMLDRHHRQAARRGVEMPVG